MDVDMFQCFIINSVSSIKPGVILSQQQQHNTSTTRIKRLLELISSYSFNVYYIKDMILSDFLSREKHDNSNPHDIIPISFNMHNILHKLYYNLGLTDKY